MCRASEILTSLVKTWQQPHSAERDAALGALEKEAEQWVEAGGSEPFRLATIDRAREVHTGEDVVIDSDAALSIGDNGVWVEAWAWLRYSEFPDHWDADQCRRFLSEGLEVDLNTIDPFYRDDEDDDDPMPWEDEDWQIEVRRQLLGEEDDTTTV